MGGAEKQVCDLADKLSLRGVNVIVISLADRVVVQPLLKDVRVYSINMKKIYLVLFVRYGVLGG